jgi:hypothetical protein
LFKSGAQVGTARSSWAATAKSLVAPRDLAVTIPAGLLSKTA